MSPPTYRATRRRASDRATGSRQASAPSRRRAAPRAPPARWLRRRQGDRIVDAGDVAARRQRRGDGRRSGGRRRGERGDDRADRRCGGRRGLGSDDHQRAERVGAVAAQRRRRRNGRGEGDQRAVGIGGGGGERASASQQLELGGREGSLGGDDRRLSRRRRRKEPNAEAADHSQRDAATEYRQKIRAQIAAAKRRSVHQDRCHRLHAQPKLTPLMRRVLSGECLRRINRERHSPSRSAASQARFRPVAFRDLTIRSD